MENDPGRQLVRGHTYSNIVSRDQAQVHIGDRHNYGYHSNHSHNYYFCASSSQQSSQVFTLSKQAIACGASEPLSLKRRRSLDEKQYPHKIDKGESLEQVFSKLGKLSKSIQDQRIGKDARKILRRIALAINAVKAQQAGLPGHSIVESLTRMDHDKSDFKNIRRNLKNAERIDVNAGLQRMRYARLTRVVRKYDKIAFEQWEVSLKTVILESRRADGTEVTDSLITLCLGPRFPGSDSPVAVHFKQTKTHTGVSFINPVILAYRVVPEDAEVFDMVAEDDIVGLVALLADGKATLRDCDEMGTTLLHHACAHDSPRCCQYLVDKGADVERIAMESYETDRIIHVIPLYSCLHIGKNPHCSEWGLRCAKILLKSGADPTFSDETLFSPVLSAITHSPAFVEPIFAESISFLDPKNYREKGESLWLDACRYAHPSAPSTLQILLDAGCDVAETDDDGRNCLFHSVLGSDYRSPNFSYDLEKLVYLLSIFDNIHARDVKFYTISDHLENSQDDSYGSYRRDLWYCALERAGIDVSSHLVQHPRVPSYTVLGWRQYTPEHYHALKHLQSWNRENFRAQMNRLLEEIPLDEDEALEMERLQRLERKRFKIDLDSDVEWSTDDEPEESDNEYDSDNESESDNESKRDAQLKSDDRLINVNQSGSENESEPDIP